MTYSELLRVSECSVYPIEPHTEQRASKTSKRKNSRSSSDKQDTHNDEHGTLYADNSSHIFSHDIIESREDSDKGSYDNFSVNSEVEYIKISLRSMKDKAKIILFNISVLMVIMIISGVSTSEWRSTKQIVDPDQYPDVKILKTIRTYHNDTGMVELIFSFGLWVSCARQPQLITEACTRHDFMLISGSFHLIRALVLVALFFLLISISLIILLGPLNEYRLSIYCFFSLLSALIIVVSLILFTLLPNKDIKARGLGYSFILTAVGSSLLSITSVSLFTIIVKGFRKVKLTNWRIILESG